MTIPQEEISALEVVGYATTLTPTMLPTVVPPVFRHRSDPKRCFLPPYMLADKWLLNATEVNSAELDGLRAAGEITLFDTTFPAWVGYELWVDQKGQPCYMPCRESHAELAQITDASILSAENALRAGDLDEATRLAGIALSADDQLASSLAIMAAVHRARNDQVGERLMRKAAEPLLGGTAFDGLVSYYRASIASRDG